jgi:hypothetical protein
VTCPCLVLCHRYQSANALGLFMYDGMIDRHRRQGVGTIPPPRISHPSQKTCPSDSQCLP